MAVRSMQVRRRVLGKEHEDTLNWREAEELFVQVMETSSRVLGEEHPDTLTSMANMAHTWKSQCRNEEAILLIEKCLELQKRILGRHHPNTETSLKALNRWQRENSETGV
jgi:hypothetical protein